MRGSKAKKLRKTQRDPAVVFLHFDPEEEESPDAIPRAFLAELREEARVKVIEAKIAEAKAPYISQRKKKELDRNV